jgi:CTP:molybdopterin cytidylyltransferase MocA
MDLPADVLLALNDDERSEMIDSIRLGLATWETQAPPRPGDGYLVCPADHPGIPTEDFNGCIAAFRAASDRIVIATHDDRRGHPIIFPAALATFVRSPACDNGLRSLPAQHADRVLTVARGSPATVRDVDTPNDYRRLHADP